MQKSSCAMIKFSFAALFSAAAAVAQQFPDKSIRMIVPLPPGASSDFLARTLGLKLTDAYKQQIVVDNRPGAGGLIGSGLVAKATPDGYTLAMVAPPHLVAPMLQAEQPYRPLEDFAAVIQVASITNVIVVAPGVPAKSVQGLVALAKAKPGEFNFGSLGFGTSSHMAAEIFNLAAGIKVVHVPFKLMADVNTESLAGRIHYFVFPAPAALTLMRDGKLRPVAVTTARRSATFPELPTVAEGGLPAAQSDAWFGVVAPAGTPQRIVNKLNADILKILREADTQEKFARQGAELVDDTSPTGFAKLLQSEYVRYQKVVRDTGLKPQ